MNHRNKELAVNTVILGIGQLIPKILILLILPILTTYLSTEEYGDFDLVQSFASLLIPLLTMQIQQAVFRHLLATKTPEGKEAYVTSALAYVICSSVPLITIIFGGLLLFIKDAVVSAVICLLFFSETLYQLLGQIVRGLGFNLKYSVSVIVYAIAYMAMTVLLVAMLQWGLPGVVLSLALAYLCSDLYMVLSSGMLQYLHVRAFSKQSLKELLAFSMPIVPSSIALWVVNLSDRLIITHFLGSGLNGIYAVANKIPALYSTAYSVFNLAWTETASRVSDDGDPAEYYSKLFRGLFEFLIGAMLLMIAVTPLVFKVLVKGDYGTAILQVPFLYFGVFFNSFVNFYSGIYIALKRTRQVGISSVAGAILNAGINLLLVKQIGLYAASISTAVSFGVIVLYRAYDLNKAVKIQYDFKGILVGMGFFTLSAILLYIGSIPSILICVVLAVGYNWWKNRGIVWKVFGMIKRKL